MGLNTWHSERVVCVFVDSIRLDSHRWDAKAAFRPIQNDSSRPSGNIAYPPRSCKPCGSLQLPLGFQMPGQSLLHQSARKTSRLLRFARRRKQAIAELCRSLSKLTSFSMPEGVNMNGLLTCPASTLRIGTHPLMCQHSVTFRSVSLDAQKSNRQLLCWRLVQSHLRLLFCGAISINELHRVPARV